MKRSYCDNCGAEINKDNRFSTFEVKVEKVSFFVEMEDASPIEYDACKYCVIDAINKLDDRPKER